MMPLRTIALLGREPGFLVLKDTLIDNPNIDLKGVFSHARLPKSEGNGPRGDFSQFQTLCDSKDIPLFPLDFPEAKTLENHLPRAEFDLLVVLSWRFLVSNEALNRFRLGGLNLHRGALPQYKGAEPVKRALENGDKQVAITAHRMTEIIDDGLPLAMVWLDVAPTPNNTTTTQYAERIKKQLYPLYAPLARTAIEAISA
ncbi:MAG: hypothetical protein HQL54_02775 [Magnetococcales bacterium]|nr:hypothetical protein [Magnetococcales bacterium]